MYAQHYLSDQLPVVMSEELPNFSANMLDRGAEVMWAIHGKVKTWENSKVSGASIGFTDDLKRSLAQLNRNIGSGSKNRTIIDKLVPWFEGSGMLNVFLALFTGNIRLVVNDKTNFTLEARQLCQDQRQRRVHELPKEMVLTHRALDFESKWTRSTWAVFIVELDDTAKRLDIM